MDVSSIIRATACRLVLLAWVSVTAGADLRVTEIDRGHSWVSPYWGYSAPKVVFDGTAYYTAGLWGDTPETSEGAVYRFDEQTWVKGARLPGVYQPALLLLDSAKRLIALYNGQNKPIVVLRAARPGTIDAFDTLPSPATPNGYYLGAAIRDDVLYLAYASLPGYSMYLTRLDLATRQWSTPVPIAEGQVSTLPKTAWTYPILFPDARGLHLCASNCPDGGEGNTYNIVWYLFFPNGSDTPSVREQVAESPVGYNAFATDMTVEADGTVHIVHMWNGRRYGAPLPPGAPAEGMYHQRRDPASGKWTAAYLTPICIAGFWNSGTSIEVITQDAGVLTRRAWDPAHAAWSAPTPLLDPKQAPAPSTFMDVLAPSSGSALTSSPALVTDGPAPGKPGSAPQRILWAVLP